MVFFSIEKPGSVFKSGCLLVFTVLKRVFPVAIYFTVAL
jgi:hypothetical protein